MGVNWDEILRYYNGIHLRAGLLGPFDSVEKMLSYLLDEGTIKLTADLLGVDQEEIEAKIKK
jgi:hypothetical protein